MTGLKIRKDGTVDGEHHTGLITPEIEIIKMYQEANGIMPIADELVIDLEGVDVGTLGQMVSDYQPGQEIPESAIEYLNEVFRDNADRYKLAEEQAQTEDVNSAMPSITDLVDRYRVEKTMLDLEHQARQNHLWRKTQNYVNTQVRMALEENSDQYRANIQMISANQGKQQQIACEQQLVDMVRNNGCIIYQMPSYQPAMQMPSLQRAA